MEDPLQPDSAGPIRLRDSLTGFFSSLPYVERVAVFGSLSRGDWDRWSDVDMIVVASGGPPAYRALFTGLQQFKPLRYHSKFRPRAEPSGGRVLANFFVDESLFHLLDLNFFSPAQYASADHIARFGPLKELYVRRHRAERLASPTQSRLPGEDSPELDPRERELLLATFYTRRDAKEVLRDRGGQRQLASSTRQLRDTLARFPKGFPIAGGDLLKIAHGYLRVAELLLAGA